MNIHCVLKVPVKRALNYIVRNLRRYKMSRDELLSGLSEASQLMQQIIELQNRIGQQSKSYARQVAYKKPFGKAKSIIITFVVSWILLSSTPLRIIPIVIVSPLGLMGVDVIPVFNVLVLVMSILIAVFGGLVISKIISRKEANAKDHVDKNNIVIQNYNRKLSIEIEQLKQDIISVQQRYHETIAPWYPQDYCNLEACDYFLSVVKNYRANTISEMVNLYEDDMHKMRMEQGQQAMLKQQKLNSMLQVGTILMQGATLGAIRDNTNAVDDMHTTVKYRKKYYRK